MSGICGVVSSPGQRVYLDPVLQGIAYRGVDAVTSWADDGVGLGHALLATTIEAETEVLPLRHSESGCVITADARLDNREKLAGYLGISLTDRPFGDAELILLAYLKEGSDCPSRLLGDFAFAIWDPRDGSLFCARDHMGVRPFYYSVPSNCFVFASDFDAVRLHPHVHFEINASKIGEFLEGREGHDFTSTLAKGILRLPPAHSLSWRAGEIALKRYWTISPCRKAQLFSNDEYLPAFKEVFEEAVRCRLRSNRSVAATLSGGVDSGAVASTAAHILKASGIPKLITVSAISERENCQETARIFSQAANPLFETRFVRAEQLVSRLPFLRDAFQNRSEPFDYWMSLLRSVYLSAKESGCRVVLDGGAGDLVFTNGNRAAELLKDGRPLAAIRAIRDRRSFMQVPTSVVMECFRTVWATFAPQFLRTIWHRMRRKGQTDLIPRAPLRPFGANYRTTILSDPSVAAGNERYERAAALANIEPRDPFLDIRVVSMCLALPSDMLEQDGWPKFILRKAMAGRIPETVLWSPGKVHLGPLFTEAVTVNWPEYSKEASNLTSLSPYTDEALAPLASARPEKLISLVSLSFWLNRVK